MSRARFTHQTPAQLRAFRLLTIAQLVHLEELGLGIGTPPSAKKAAMTALDIGGDGSRLTAGELIDQLRAAARDAVGIAPDHGRAPQKPYMPKPDEYEATT